MDKYPNITLFIQKLYTHCGKWCRLTRFVSCSVNASCSWRDDNNQLALEYSSFFNLLKLLILIRSSSALILSSAALITLSSRFLKLQFQRFRKVPALRAAFITFRNLRFSKSILVTAVCLFVVSVCLSVCLSSNALQAARLSDRPDFFFQKMSSGHATMQNFFFWKSDKRQGQGHHFCEKQIMGHNYRTGSGRDFWLVAQRSLYNSASVRGAPFWRTTSRFYVTWL